MPETIQRRKLSDLIAEHIQHYIIDNKLKPGSRLPTEQEFADRFGVSRISTREATKALAFLGIIDAAPRRGLVVGQVDMKRVSRYLGFHLAISDFPPAQILDTRLVIETGALPYLMKQMTADQTLHARLTELGQQIVRTSNLDERIKADAAFHRALIDFSGVEPLVAFHDLVTIFFDRFRPSLAAGDWEFGCRQHQQILDTLRDGKLKQACDILTSHMEHHRKYHRNLNDQKSRV